MDELFTWATLATYAGATIATSMLTQLIKGIPLLKKMPTRVLSYLLALVLLFAASFFTNTLTLQSGLLCLINAAVVGFASNGAFDAAAGGRASAVKTVKRK